MAFGRPTNYTDEMLQKARDYVDNFKRDAAGRGEVVPSIVGLCRYIGRGQSTVYDWVADPAKEDFSDIVNEIKEYQHFDLINNAITGAYHHSIAKLMLTKHGYSDKQEVDVTSREEVTPWGDIQTDE